MSTTRTIFVTPNEGVTAPSSVFSAKTPSSPKVLLGVSNIATAEPVARNPKYQGGSLIHLTGITSKLYVAETIADLQHLSNA